MDEEADEVKSSLRKTQLGYQNVDKVQQVGIYTRFVMKTIVLGKDLAQKTMLAITVRNEARAP